MTINTAIKTGYPGATDEICEYILWSRTAFPFALMTAKILYKAANTFYRAKKSGVRLCDFCDRIEYKNRLCIDHQPRERTE